MPVEELRESEMMSHLLDSLDRGENIGHYGRLVFVMVARHFMSDDELIEYLKKDPDCDDEKARGLVKQVESRGYNPPRRERVLAWMKEQDFPICESATEGESCNVYKSLNFPKEVYDKISGYYEGGRQ